MWVIIPAVVCIFSNICWLGIALSILTCRAQAIYLICCRLATSNLLCPWILDSSTTAASGFPLVISFLYILFIAIYPNASHERRWYAYFTTCTSYNNCHRQLSTRMKYKSATLVGSSGRYHRGHRHAYFWTTRRVRVLSVSSCFEILQNLSCKVRKPRGERE